MSVIINLFAGPGSGKSTLAHGLMFELKSRGISAEFAHEWIKHPVWQGRMDFPQYYVWAKQQKLVDGLNGKVDVIVTDSPPFMSLAYQDDEWISKEFVALVAAKHHLGPKPLNVFVDRVKEYKAAGRYQSEEKARELDKYIEDLLINNKIQHYHTGYFYDDGRVATPEEVPSALVRRAVDML